MVGFDFSWSVVVAAQIGLNLSIAARVGTYFLWQAYRSLQT